MWQELKEKWLGLMTGYRKYEEMYLSYLNSEIPLSVLNDYEESLIKMGADVDKLCDIRLRVTKKRLDVV